MRYALCIVAIAHVLGACGNEINADVQDEQLTPTFAVATAPADGGLVGQYYAGTTFGALKLTRTDAQVGFDWGAGSPGVSVPRDGFSVRWSGFITPEHSEQYTFYTVSDDGVRLTVNGTRLIDDWSDHSAREDQGSITLEAGKQYPIAMEFYENGGNARASLAWSSRSVGKQIIPASRLSTAVKTGLSVRAYGQLAGGVGPIMEVRVNGALLGRTEVRASAYTSYPFAATITEGDDIDVVFTNDGVVAGADRNLFVESITVADTVILATAADVAYDRGAGAAAFDGLDVIAGQSGMYYSGSLRFSAPGDGVPPGQPPQSAKTPTPASIAGKRVVGRIDAANGQVIENVHVINHDGPCIVVYQGRSNITIRNSEIGPCGDTAGSGGSGVFILEGAHDVTVTGNVIHDVSVGVYSYRANHPIVVEHNYFYDIRGPFPSGQAVQHHTISGTGGRTKITCNVIDDTYGDGPRKYEDHINLLNAKGTAANPIEVAYNRIRGGANASRSQSGTGIMTGDSADKSVTSEYQWVHHNTVVLVANTGIAVAGGLHITIEDNLVYNAGADAGSLTFDPYYVRGFSQCDDVLVRDNRGIGRRWAWGHSGEASPSTLGVGPEPCTHVTLTNNAVADKTLTASIFDREYSECE